LISSKEEPFEFKTICQKKKKNKENKKKKSKKTVV